MIRYSIIALFFVSLSGAVAWADHGKGAVAGKTLSPRSLHEENWSLDTGFQYQKSENFTDDRLLDADARGHDLHGVDWRAEFSVSVSYGVTDHLTLSASVPFEVLHGFRFVEAGVVNEANSIVGTGDATFMAKYALLADPVELALIAGVKIPTGSTGQLSNTGDLLEPNHQPGTGSWDPLLGVAAGRQYERLWLGASVLYRITTEGRHEFTPGQSVLFAVKAEYQLIGMGKFPRLYGAVELSEQFTAKDKFSGVKDQDTGGSLIGLGFGLRLRADEHMTIAAMVTIPVYQGLYGEQHKERYELLFGTAYDF